MIDAIFDKLISFFGSPEPVVLILAALPIAEVRLAIPVAIKYGMPPLKAFLLSFLGSTAVTAVLLAVLLPFIRFLSRTKIFKKFGDAVLKKASGGAEKIIKKAGKNKSGGTEISNKTKSGNLNLELAAFSSPESLGKAENFNNPENFNTSENIGKTGALKKMLGIGAFVAVPLPLTGVWSGSLVAGILELKYFKSLLAVTGGNLVAAAIVTVASVYFAEYIDIMVAAFAVLALAAVVLLLIKAFLGGKKNK